jgi:Putative Flp pilus-assembly TadE/G-like
MTPRFRHRQRAQIAPLALYAMLVLTGAVALVVDAGVFFVTQRQLQTAADAAALAAVWYHPVCDQLPSAVECAPQTPAPATQRPPAGWTCTPPAGSGPNGCMATDVAFAVAQANLGHSGALCRPAPELLATGRSDILPTGNGPLPTYIVTIDCEAPYWFARIFPAIPATMHIRAFARAGIGYATPTGITAVQQTPLPELTTVLLT